MNQSHCDSIRVKILDSVNYGFADIEMNYADGDHILAEFEDEVVEPISVKEISDAVLRFQSSAGHAADCMVLSVEYLKNGAVVGSSLVQSGSCELKLLKYKVELPRGAKVTLFDDESLDAQFVSWNLPCPTSLPNMTFLQVKAANGFEQQITPSAGSYSVEVWTELGRRYAVFGEIWTYSFEQTLWFADLKVQLSNYDWVDCVPTAGEGGTIVTALPQ